MCMYVVTAGTVRHSHRLGQEVDPDGRLVVLVEVVVHETGDDAGLPHALVSQEDQLVLRQRGDLRDSGVPTVLPETNEKKRRRETGAVRFASSLDQICQETAVHFHPLDDKILATLPLDIPPPTPNYF